MDERDRAAAAPALPRRDRRAADQARAYAYGGSLIQDLGYYPFGSHLFTNLTHYVRSGDFVESMLRNAKDLNEYAFALGALAHYASDNTGHPLAVNRSVPLMYPKVRAKTGPVALYVDSPARHVMVEFAFDVLQVAKGGYVAQAYRDRIGFEVSKELLERAVRDTYALELEDLLLSVDLAIGTLSQGRQQHDPGADAHRLARQARGDRGADARRHRSRVRLHLSRPRITTGSSARSIASPGSWRARSRSC